MKSARWFLLASLLAPVLLAPSRARADLPSWLTAVASGTTNVFVDTNIAAPTTRDIGSLGGSRTYEFVVNATLDGQSSCLLSRNDGSPNQAIKFEQSSDTQRYGVTAWGAYDSQFASPQVTAGTPVHLAFVSLWNSNTTTVYVNGVPRSSINARVTLTGTVAVGQAGPSGGDPLTGTIIGFATYDEALSQTELRDHASAYFGAAPPAILPRPLVEAVVFYLGRDSGDGSNPDARASIPKICDGLSAGLDDAYWQDDQRLSAEGSKFFSIASKAMKSVASKVASNADGNVLSDAECSLEDLGRACGVLADNAIEDAVNAVGGDPKAQKSIAKAQAAYAAGRTAADAGDWLGAVKSFKKAWSTAAKLLD